MEEYIFQLLLPLKNHTVNIPGQMIGDNNTPLPTTYTRGQGRVRVQIRGQSFLQQNNLDIRDDLRAEMNKSTNSIKKVQHAQHGQDQTSDAQEIYFSDQFFKNILSHRLLSIPQHLHQSKSQTLFLCALPMA